MHPTDDLTTRSAVMVARAAAENRKSVELVCPDLPEVTVQSVLEQIALGRGRVATADDLADFRGRIRRLALSDAALARAIDAVPGAITAPDDRVMRCYGATDAVSNASVNAERIARFHAEADAVPGRR